MGKHCIEIQKKGDLLLHGPIESIQGEDTEFRIEISVGATEE